MHVFVCIELVLFFTLQSAPSFPPPPGSGPVPYGGRKSPATGQYAYRPGQGADDLPPPPPSSQPPYQMQVNIQAPGGDTGRKSPSSQYIPIQVSGTAPAADTTTTTAADAAAATADDVRAADFSHLLFWLYSIISV